MLDGFSIVLGIVGSIIAILVILGAHDLGKKHMRDEVKTYGCEQAIKGYKD